MKATSQYCVWTALRCGLLAAAAIQAAHSQTTQINLGTQGRNVDFSNASSTRPVKTGATLPTTCSPGQMFFNTSAPAGQNLYGCSATNTWTLQSGSTGLADPGANGLVIRTNQNTTSVVAAPAGTVVGTSDAQTLTNKSINASEINSGTLSSSVMPAFSGDITNTAGSTTVTLATVNSNTGTFGDASHTLQLSIDGKGRITAVTPVAVNLGNNSNATSLVTGTMSGIPSTCSIGALYFATDQQAGQQIYTCSSTNTWTQTGTVGTSGALSDTNGAIDVNTSVIPRLAAANNWTGLNLFQPGIQMTEQASCATPATGTDCYYTNSTDHLLHKVDSTGADAAISGSTGTTTPGSTSFSSVTGGTNSTAAMIVGSGASLTTAGTGTIAATSLIDSNQNPAISVNAVASAVDQISISNSAAGGTPSISASGTDTNIPLTIAGKGTGQLNLNGTTAHVDASGNLTVASCTGCTPSISNPVPFFYSNTASGVCGSNNNITLDTATIPANTLKIGDFVEVHALIKSTGGGNAGPWFQIGFGNNGAFPSFYSGNVLLSGATSYYTADYNVMVTGQTSQEAYGYYASPSANQGPWGVIPNDTGGGQMQLVVPSEDITAAIAVAARVNNCGGTTSPNSYTISWTIKATH